MPEADPRPDPIARLAEMAAEFRDNARRWREAGFAWSAPTVTPQDADERADAMEAVLGEVEQLRARVAELEGERDRFRESLRVIAYGDLDGPQARLEALDTLMGPGPAPA